MINIKSQRAKKLLETPKFFKSAREEGMMVYPTSAEKLEIKLLQENGVVKNLSFFGNIPDDQKVLLESMASLLIGKKLSSAENISARECEASLRDRNSEMALENMGSEAEDFIKAMGLWLLKIRSGDEHEEYQFSSDKGPFNRLKLVDKVRELKGFLNSREVVDLYRDLTRPELVDVEDLTVYVLAPYQSSEEKSVFEKLHLLGVATFQEENLNFIPEA